MTMPLKKMRGVIIYDIEIEGGYSAVGAVEKHLKAVAKGFANELEDVTKKHSIENVKVIHTQAALTDRRGQKTGPIDKIVFRN